MVKVKLSETYSNEFLTTHNGYVFYRKNNSLGREENIVDIDLNNFEAASLLQQGVLKLVQEDSKVLEKNNEDIYKKTQKGVNFKDAALKEDTPKEVIKDAAFERDVTSIKESNKANGLENVKETTEDEENK